MELFMDIVTVVAVVVWVIVGIQFIKLTEQYYRAVKPVLYPMMKQYLEMVNSKDEE